MTSDNNEQDADASAQPAEHWPAQQPTRFATGTQRTDLQQLQADGSHTVSSERELCVNSSDGEAVFVIGPDGRVAQVDATTEPTSGFGDVEGVGGALASVIAVLEHPPAVRVADDSGPMPGGSGEFMTHTAEVDLIVHDLKNPLATIGLEASLLDDRLALLDGGTIRRALHRIKHNVEYLARIVDDLLDLSALDHGRLTIRYMRTELRSLLEQVIDRAVSTRDHDRMVLEAPEPITVRADDLRIERVVVNLLQNALKYSPGKSSIVVRLDQTGGCARVSVTDVGPGIDPNEQNSIFERFRRGSGTGAHEGSGLGLYVSKKIVEAHGGRIGVDSRPGSGCRFFFELPLTRPPRP